MNLALDVSRAHQVAEVLEETVSAVPVLAVVVLVAEALAVEAVKDFKIIPFLTEIHLILGIQKTTKIFHL